MYRPWIAVQGDTLLAKVPMESNFWRVRPGAKAGTWQVEKVPEGGTVTPLAGGFLAIGTEVTHAIQANFARTVKTVSRIARLDEASGAARWSVQWEGRTAESPALVQDRVYVYSRERNVGTFCVGLDASGQQVQRFALPFEWNISAGVLQQGRELFYYGRSSYGGFIMAYDPARGQQTWRQDLGFVATRAGLSGTQAVLHYPLDQGPYAILDLATHQVLHKGAIEGILDRRFAVVGEAAYFWGLKASGRTGYLQCLDLKTLKIRWERAFDVDTRVTAGLVAHGGRLWALVQGPQGPTRLQGLDPATGATLLDAPLDARLDLDPPGEAIAFQDLLLVGTRRGGVLGYSLHH